MSRDVFNPHNWMWVKRERLRGAVLRGNGVRDPLRPAGGDAVSEPSAIGDVSLLVPSVGRGQSRKHPGLAWERAVRRVCW